MSRFFIFFFEKLLKKIVCNKETVLLLHRQNRQPPLCNEIRTSKEMPKEMDEHVCPTIPIASFKISITKEPSLCYTKNRPSVIQSDMYQGSSDMKSKQQ